MIVAAFGIALALSVWAALFWSLGAGVGHRRALDTAQLALRAEAQARKDRGQTREGLALEFGAFVVEELERAPAGAWRGET